MHTNSGSNTFTNIENLKLLPLDIHKNENYMENLLSLKDVASIHGVDITIYSSKEMAITVDNGDKIDKFKECRGGLYYHAVISDNSTKSNNTVNYYIMVQTVKVKKAYPTREDIEKVDRERRVQKVIVWPRNSTFKSIIKKQLI